VGASRYFQNENAVLRSALCTAISGAVMVAILPKLLFLGTIMRAKGRKTPFIVYKVLRAHCNAK
jgi:hypothetical protein